MYSASHPIISGINYLEYVTNGPEFTYSTQAIELALAIPYALAGVKTREPKMIDLKAMSFDELVKLSKDVEKAIATAESRRKKEARAALEKVAKEYGVSVEDILNSGEAKPAKKKRGPKAKAPKAKASKPKYRNPDDPTQTWTGKGRRPAWYIAAVDAGKTEKQLAI